MGIACIKNKSIVYIMFYILTFFFITVYYIINLINTFISLKIHFIINIINLLINSNKNAFLFKLINN